MSTTAILPPREDGFVRKKWSGQECEFLVKSGLLSPGKYELIAGEIILKTGQGRLHIAVVTRIIAALIVLFGIDAIQSQAQIGIGIKDEFNDPEPDVTVLRGSVLDYIEHEPDPSTDVLLVVEASHTTLPGDTTTKALIYAKQGIPEYWVVSIVNHELIVYRQPTQIGYSQVQVFLENESIAPLASPDKSVQVKDLLP